MEVVHLQMEVVVIGVVAVEEVTLLVLTAVSLLSVVGEVQETLEPEEVHFTVVRVETLVLLERLLVEVLVQVEAVQGVSVA